LEALASGSKIVDEFEKIALFSDFATRQRRHWNSISLERCHHFR